MQTVLIEHRLRIAGNPAVAVACTLPRHAEIIYSIAR